MVLVIPLKIWFCFIMNFSLFLSSHHQAQHLEQSRWSINGRWVDKWCVMYRLVNKWITKGEHGPTKLPGQHRVRKLRTRAWGETIGHWSVTRVWCNNREKAKPDRVRELAWAWEPGQLSGISQRSKAREARTWECKARVKFRCGRAVFKVLGLTLQAPLCFLPGWQLG